MTLASGSGAIGSFLRVGKPIIGMLGRLLHERTLDEAEAQRAARLIQRRSSSAISAAPFASRWTRR